MIRVALVEDHAGFRESLEALLGGTANCVCVGSFPDARSALERLPAEPADVVLMDLHLPGEDGLDCIRRLRTLLPTVPIVMLTIEENTRLVFAALEAGASGYLVKSGTSQEIVAALEEAHRGGSPMTSHIARLVVESFHRRSPPLPEAARLTKREQEILEHLARGWSSKEIAQELSLSIHTVHTHLRHIYEKLHVRSRTAAASKYWRG
ncbi:MAG: response regulator transcription factor [Verrucomicrobia bacterium]|nr:response regulator transcription factor [Verrucomicrobiota bacterium]